MRLECREGVWPPLPSFNTWNKAVHMLGLKEYLSNEVYSAVPIFHQRGFKDVICFKPSQLSTDKNWIRTTSLLLLEMLSYHPRGITIS